MFGIHGWRVRRIASYPQDGQTTVEYKEGPMEGERSTVPTHELRRIDA